MSEQGCEPLPLGPAGASAWTVAVTLVRERHAHPWVVEKGETLAGSKEIEKEKQRKKESPTFFPGPCLMPLKPSADAPAPGPFTFTQREAASPLPAQALPPQPKAPFPENGVVLQAL